MITLDIELVWNRTTTRTISSISRWCEQLGEIAADRRFVVKVAVMVTKPRWSIWTFWKNPEVVFQNNCERLAASAKSLPNVVFLDPLGGIELQHLQDWRDEMIEEFGPREDDELGDTRLCQIVPPQTQRSMGHVAEALKEILSRCMEKTI